MHFNYFVLPFCIGACILFATLIYNFYKWLKAIDKKQYYFVKKQFFSIKTINAIIENFKEALLHFKIFKKNKRLGYMHLSLAFGWFLLIVVGKIEASVYSNTLFEEPWLGIFFRYFVREEHNFFMAKEFAFIMDLLLLFIISGLLLAFYKRLRSVFFGMKKTTKHSKYDKIALTSLWLIFPFRLLSESISAGITNNGSFLTNSIGHLIKCNELIYFEPISWWLYSIALCMFFIFLPFSRYMHIPTEVLLIFLRQWGVKAGEFTSGYTDISINACSRCGICIDACQLDFAANITNVQSVYVLRDKRYNMLSMNNLNNCLLCGRCATACPVGIDLNAIRQQLRYKPEKIIGKHYYQNIVPELALKNVDVIYFAGCMTHLNPTIINAMKQIFCASKTKFWFMDEDKTICCGRPLRQQGLIRQSKDLISKNSYQINHVKAKYLVTSCPICYKSFKDEYKLKITILHHTEFIQMLIKDKKLILNSEATKYTYHDPCELGRNGNIYDAPREIIEKIGKLENVELEKQNALCCGASLANTAIELDEQNKIKNHCIEILNAPKPDYIISACPLCKKTLNNNKYNVKVKDIAEIVANNIEKNDNFVNYAN